MTGQRIRGIALGGAAFLLAAFLYVASSPWLVWFTLSGVEGHAAPTTAIIFSAAVPAALRPYATADFSSLGTRWQYVARHSTRTAWAEAVKTLVLRRVPFQPAAVIATDTWFDSPALIIATNNGPTWMIEASEGRELPLRKTVVELPPAPAADMVQLMLPGSAFTSLPPSLRTYWNELARQKLGFTATTPDILTELGRYQRVLIKITGPRAAVGIAPATPEEKTRWAAALRRWVVDEDRFRRPLTQTFRLPDGTKGTETVAGLPGDVWQESDASGCRAPLPQKPPLWLCENAEQIVLASYPSSEKAADLGAGADWAITIGQDYLHALPGVLFLRAAGTDQAVAGVVEEAR